MQIIFTIALSPSFPSPLSLSPAKEALEKEPKDDLMPFSGLKLLSARYIHQVWQKEWDEAMIASNKVLDIFPTLSDKLITVCNTRKEDTVLNRLHIGRFYFTHSFLLKKEEPPVCVTCNTTVTVKHILIECADSVEIRNVNPEKILDYLKEIGMFYKV